MNLLRRSEYVPPMDQSESRRLRGLPSSWEAPVAESAVEGLSRRARALAAGLAVRGRRRDAEELLRAVALLERADELHQHASDVETLVGLYRALAAFAGEREPVVASERTWAQAGVLADQPPSVHGPAFRETAALRNRAFHSLAARLSRLAREPGGR